MHPSLAAISLWVVGGRSLGARTAAQVAAAASGAVQTDDEITRRFKEAGKSVAGLVLSAFPCHPLDDLVSELLDCPLGK